MLRMRNRSPDHCNQADTAQRARERRRCHQTDIGSFTTKRPPAAHGTSPGLTGQTASKGSGDLARGGVAFVAVEVAFPEVIGNLIERALFPCFRFRQPEQPAFSIQHGALAAHELLAANFDKLPHELHSRGVKPIYSESIA